METRSLTAKRSAAVWFLLLAATPLAALAAASFDMSVYRAVSSLETNRAVRDLFNACEAFGNGWGVVMVIFTVVALDTTRRVQFSRFFAASLGAGLVADGVKMMIQRTRPHGVGPEVASAWDTFGEWMPLMSAGSVGQSFPSAHTATAFGLTFALSLAYPRGARLFWAFATGVALQRVFVGAHFLSDVIVGAGVGVFWGRACFYSGPVFSAFNKMETWWADYFKWTLPNGHAGLTGGGLKVVGPALNAVHAEPAEAEDRAEPVRRAA